MVVFLEKCHLLRIPLNFFMKLYLTSCLKGIFFLSSLKCPFDVLAWHCLNVLKIFTMEFSVTLLVMVITHKQVIAVRQKSVCSFKMDDCNLEKLSIKPGKLSPVFKQDVLQYNATVPSNVEKVTLDTLTRDSGASYTISVWAISCYCPNVYFLHLPPNPPTL